MLPLLWLHLLCCPPLVLLPSDPVCVYLLLSFHSQRWWEWSWLNHAAHSWQEVTGPWCRRDYCNNTRPIGEAISVHCVADVPCFHNTEQTERSCWMWKTWQMQMDRLQTKNYVSRKLFCFHLLVKFILKIWRPVTTNCWLKRYFIKKRISRICFRS